ncbi:MAG: carbon-nitrogen family hydrolase [Lachnospiraceae bacterium]|nr:carbon-nitrogen family hydrolase [Lachnospiraceae bacterium]MDE6920746.1 carbon-nitrogen family hydrolase [Lachnospiraceae bacterium]
MKLALVQPQIVWEEKERNYASAGKWIGEAVRQGAEAVFFPEMSFTGFSMNTKITGEKDARTIDHMSALARQHHVSVGFGWVKDCAETCGKCENHYTIVDSAGDVLSDYAKLHPFSYSGEDLRFQGGSALAHFALRGIPCSSFICYDLRFPEVFQAVSGRAHVIIVPANWPAKRRDHWRTLLRARAIENQVYILAVNCVGEIGGISYTGDSCVIGPDGDARAELSGTEGMIVWELSDDVERLRREFPVKRDRRETFYAELLRGAGESEDLV